MPDDENVPEREVETEWEVETGRETQIAREAEIEEETEQKVKQKILQVVMSRGAVLPVEVAVQTYSFPEEIAEPLAKLEEEGVIERQGLKGSEMIVLTQKGLEQLKAGLV
jgi:hypothetical protein